jgi:hypothetical protein
MKRPFSVLLVLPPRRRVDPTISLRLLPTKVAILSPSEVLVLDDLHIYLPIVVLVRTDWVRR